MKKQFESGKKGKEEKWKGIVPFLRFIHCLTDCDDIRKAFLKSLTFKTRVQDKRGIRWEA